MADCARAFDPLNDHLPHGWWPLVLYNLGKQYVLGEHQGQEGTGQYEAALLRHVAAQGDTPGPVKDSLTTMRQLHKTALENEVGTWDRLQDSNLKRILAPILKSRTRLAAMLEVEDLVNEAVVAASEIANEPWLHWELGKKWSAKMFQPTEQFMRRFVERLVSRRYGADRQIERVTVAFDDDTIPTADNALGQVEWQQRPLVSGLHTFHNEADVLVAQLETKRKTTMAQATCRMRGWVGQFPSVAYEAGSVQELRR